MKTTTHVYDKRSSLALKRTLSPKLYKQSRRDKSKLSVQPYRLDQFHINTNKIQFFFRGGHSQFVYNRDLKLINKTGIEIGFKIKSNNPQNYEVTPSQSKIEDGGISQIRIRLYVQAANISKYWMDKFLIEWGAYNEINGIANYTEKAYLKVQVTTDINVLKAEAMNQSVATSLRQIQYYQKLISLNKQTIFNLEYKIAEEEKVPQTFVISWTMGIFLAFISFLLGYLIF